MDDDFDQFFAAVAAEQEAGPAPQEAAPTPAAPPEEAAPAPKQQAAPAPAAPAEEQEVVRAAPGPAAPAEEASPAEEAVPAPKQQAAPGPAAPAEEAAAPPEEAVPAAPAAPEEAALAAEQEAGPAAAPEEAAPAPAAEEASSAAQPTVQPPMASAPAERETLLARIKELADRPSKADDTRWQPSGWEGMDPGSIPTKPTLHPAFTAAIESAEPDSALADLGCGDGRIALQLASSQPGLGELVGVDLNSGAISLANMAATALSMCSPAIFKSATGPQPRMRFIVGSAVDPALLPGVQFGVVLAQLLVSIVGGLEERAGLLKNAARLLRPGGRLLLSASGASEEINPEYAALYSQDEPLTGEYRTYYSRDAEGKPLYVTHHFTQPELEGLLTEAGLVVESFAIEQETSSRRKGMAAVFYYVVARKEEPNK